MIYECCDVATTTTPDDVVHTVDLLIGGNVCLLPAFFMISDLRVGGCGAQTCWENKGSF